MLPLVALLTLSGFHPQPGSFQAAPQAQKYADWKAIDDLAEAIRKDYKLPALAIAYQKIGEKPSAAVAGLRSSQNNSGPVEDDDRLLVCQIGQSMTATMIAHLIDEQKFGWNTTLAQALPEIPMLDVYKSITIEQLLRHKAELPQIDRFSQDQLKAMIAKAKNATALRKAYVTALLSMEPAPLAEGQTVSTNSEYVIVGYIAEAVIHQSFDSLMQRHVFNPMKMSTALISPVGSMGQVGGNNEVVPHVLGDFGYAPYVMPVTDIDSIMAPAGAGVSCSISDLLKFAVFHLKGIQGDAQILSPASYKRLHTMEAGDKAAIGWSIQPTPGGEIAQTFTGADGTFYAEMTIYPTSNIAIVAITNAGTTRRPSPTTVATWAVKAKFEQKQ